MAEPHVPFGAAAATASMDPEEDSSPLMTARDPPAAILQEMYPTQPPQEQENDPLQDEEEEEDGEQEHQPQEPEEEDPAGSFIKMDQSQSHDDDAEQNENEEEQQGGDGDNTKQEEPDENDQDEDQDLALPMLGGSIDKNAYCLLDGIFEKDGDRKRVTIPLTRLPAVLGRSHSTGDINFFSLGPAKALSRQHCVIDYRDNVGGKLITPKSALRDTEEEKQLDYETGKPFTAINQPPQSDTNAKEDDNKENTFPPRGAFVMEALGKNLIMVGNQRLRQGEVAILTSGTPIRMSAYSLYFLLPTDITGPPKTMEIPLQTNTTNTNANKSSPPTKKSPPMMGGFKRKMPSSSSHDMPKPKVKKPKAAPFAQLQAELDALSIDVLLERMNEAVESERWERKHQLIGSTISLHAVKDATSAPEIREQAADGGVARTEIMRWIKESPKYSGWVEQMMSKMEAKSYQNTITKALLKAGNVRTGSGGRYIKWILPGVTLKPAEKEGGDAAEKPSSSTEEQKGAKKENEEEGEEKQPHNEEEEEEGAEDEQDNEEEGEGDGDDDDNENDEEAGGEHEDEGGNDMEEADGDENEAGEKEKPDAPTTNFAEQRLQEESDEDESMKEDGASFGGLAESGNEDGPEGNESPPSQPDPQDDESMEEGGGEEGMQ